MRSKSSQEQEKREEKREKSREEREEGPQRRKVLDPRNCLRFQGLGGGSKIGYPGTPNTVTAWVFEGLASKSAVSLRFRLDSRFL